jgi:hypothetical protein
MGANVGTKVSRVFKELADREAIRDTLIRYPRAVDRLDLQIAKDGVFWPDATDDHAGIAEGPISAFYESVYDLLSKMQDTQHFLCNMLIELDGERARTETYVFAYHAMQFDSRPSLLIAGGRLLDVLEKREDEWRVLKRTLLVDWMKRLFEDAAGGDMAGHRIDGCRGPKDRSYRHFHGGA